MSLVSCSTAESGDSSDASDAAVTDSATDTTEPTTVAFAEVETEYGTLQVPADMKEDMVIEQEEADGVLTITFSTELDGETYLLYTVTISDDDDKSVATIKDSDGNERYVTVLVNDMDLSSLEEEQQNKIYSMQESVNDMIDNLNAQ